MAPDWDISFRLKLIPDDGVGVQVPLLNSICLQPVKNFLPGVFPCTQQVMANRICCSHGAQRARGARCAHRARAHTHTSNNNNHNHHYNHTQTIVTTTTTTTTTTVTAATATTATHLQFLRSFLEPLFLFCSCFVVPNVCVCVCVRGGSLDTPDKRVCVPCTEHCTEPSQGNPIFCLQQ